MIVVQKCEDLSALVLSKNEVMFNFNYPAR
jgi:hypothetical protein